MNIELERKSETLKYNNEKISSFKSIKSQINGSLIFEDCIIDVLDLDNLKIKNGSLTFKRCSFTSSTILKNIRVDGDINFIECESSTLIKFFNIVSIGQIFFEYFKTDKKIEFIDVQFNLLKLSSVTMDYLNLSSNTSNNISNIDIDNSNIFNTLQLNNISNIDSISINNVKVSELRLNSILFNNSSNVFIKKSTVDFIFFDNISTNDSINLLIDDNLVEILKINTFTSNKGEISIKNGFCKNIIIGENVDENLLIDFSNSSYDNIEIDKKFYNFLTNNKSEKSILRINDFNQNSKTLQILSKMFADNYQYNLQDLCFYYYNNYVMEQSIKDSKNNFTKLIIHTKYFFGKYFFGWGVKLSNIINSFFYVIGIYSLVYIVLFFEEDITYKYKNYLLEGSILDIFYSSFLLVFGSYSDFEIKNKTIDFLMYSEHLIGILLLSILTGTIIRKLVR